MKYMSKACTKKYLKGLLSLRMQLHITHTIPYREVLKFSSYEIVEANINIVAKGFSRFQFSLIRDIQ